LPSNALYVFGQKLAHTGAVCTMGADHKRLVREARADRQKHGFDVDESYVVCLRCAHAVPLAI
jgi:hypothetical protein